MDHACMRAQANKPQWPADDCYHTCCEGGPTVKPVARKELAPSPAAVAAAPTTAAVKAAAAVREEPKKATEAAIKEAKEAKQEVAKELERDAVDVVQALFFAISFKTLNIV